VAQGMINSFDTPARQAFVVEMIEDRADLPNAIALNSSMVNASRIVGPSIGGILIAAFGEGWCFMLDAISYVAVIASLLMMTVVRTEREPRTTRAVDELRAGWDYVTHSHPIRIALLMLALVSIMGMPYTVLMPVIASAVLHGGAHTLGFLMTASGTGALLGALYLASRSSVLGLGRVIAIATAVFGAGLCVFGLSHVLWLSLAILPFIGAGFMIQMASTNTVIQTIVEERLRGRVMAFYTMAFLGTAPIGSLLAGVVAARIGASNTIIGGGVLTMLAAIWFSTRLPSLRIAVRPIYEARGILMAAETETGATTMPA